MRQKKWKERIGGNPGLVIIGAFIVLSIVLAAEHLFNLPQLLSGTPPEQFEWGELVFDIVAIFCIGLISFTLVRKSEAERSEIEQIQRRERDKGQEYLDIAGVILLALNAEQKVTLINRKGCEILGYEEEEIIGKNWFDHFLPEWERERVRATFIRLMPGGHKAAEYFENPILTKSGEERIIAWHNTLLTDETGNIAGTLSSGEDITERKKAEEELKKSAQLLRDTGEMAKVGGWELDLSTKEVLWTEEVGRIHGVEPGYKPKLEEALNFYTPESRPALELVLKKAMETGETYDLESLFIPSGSKDKIWVRSLGRAVYSGGKIIKLTGTFQNIDKYKRVEGALRESEEKYRALIEAAGRAGEGIIIIQDNKEGEAVFISVNDQFCKMSGYSEEELLGRSPWDLIPYEISVRLKDWYKRRHIGESLPGHYEAAGVHKDGTIVPLELSIVTMPWQGNIATVLYIRDITERKKAEEEIRTERDKLENVTRNIGVGLAIVSKDYRTVWANEVLKQIFGEVEGKLCYSTYNGRPDICPGCGVREVFEQGKNVSVHEQVGKDKDGNTIWSQIIATPLRDKEGNITAAMEVVVPITERKKAEEKLKISEKFLNSVIENTPNPMWISDENGTVIRMNQALRDLLKISDDEIVGKYNVLKDTQVKEQGLLPLVTSVFEKADTVEFEIDYITTREQQLQLNREVHKILDIIISPVKDSQGKVINAIAQHKDITERKKAEEEIKNLAKFPSENPYPVLRISKEGTILYANDKSLSLLDEWRTSVNQPAPDYLRQLITEVTNTGLRRNIEIEHKGRILSFIVVPICDVNYVNLYGRDITEQKQTEEKIKKSAREWEITFNSITDFVSIQDKDFKLLRVNKACTDWFKCKSEELVGRKCYEIFHGTKEPWPTCPHKKTLETRNPITEEFFDPHLQIHLEVSTSPILDEKGEVKGTIHIVKNITERKKAEKALKESEERYRNFFENAPLGIYRTTPDCRILLSNPALLQMLGYSSFEELASRNLEKEGFEPHYSRNKFKESLEKTSEVRGLESAWLRRDGSTIFVRENARAVRNEDGSILYYEGMVEDITERKKTEEALRESEERYRVLFESSAVGILVADIETKEFKYANPALCRMLGYTEDELKQMSVADIHPKEKLEYVISEFDAQARGEKTLIQDISCLRKDGTIIYADINTTKVTLDGREYNAGFFKDVTERKRAEEALKESEQEYRGVVDNIGIGVSLISPNLEILFLNKQMKKWFPNVDISKETICYRAFNSPPREEACSYCPTNKTLQDGQIHESITETPTGDKIINYRVISSPIKDLQGKVIAAIEMVEDITEKKRLQEQLIQTEKLAAVGTLAYGIAHEFNNILAGMMANAELGLISKEREQIKECFEIIVDNSHRASSITNNLLAFAREKEARKELIDITEPLKSVLAITHRELEKHNIEVIEKFRPVPKIYCDPGQFSEVFLNMITNARDAMHPKGGTLTIQVEPAEENIRIVFKDNGCGIPEEIKGRIFEPFVTTKGALGRSEVPGTGLGLFLTYGIINGYKGKIEIETKVGKGTKFSIIIPISENQPPELLPNTRIKSSKETEKKLKILLVDDEKAIILGLKKFLESKGHKVSTSLRAKEGLEIFRKGRFDLVLSDITIPDMDGIELIKKVKEKDPQAKIIVITGHLQKEKEEKAREAGADEVLIKPFKNDLLYQTISKVVD